MTLYYYIIPGLGWMGIENMEKEKGMVEKVYITHYGGCGDVGVDCFVRSEKDLTKGECEKYNIDYFMPSCVFVQEFLKKNPCYKYVGSTDNGHADGQYGMDLEGWTCVDFKDGE